MLITGVDTETTGLKQEDGHRIIEIAMLAYDTDSRKLVDSYIQRIDPDRSISSDSLAVHGITYDELVGCPKWEDVVPEIVSRMNASGLLVAHNMAFDGPFIGNEIARIGAFVPNVLAFCTMENARWACADGKSPKLGELCFALGVEYDTSKAHGAEYDVQVMMECFFRGLDRGFYELPSTLKVAA
jgi:DNA polymerase-3 subunit epsilon